MNFYDLNKYKYLFLNGFHSTDSNTLIINLKIGEVSNQTEDLLVNGVIIHGTKPIIENNHFLLRVKFPSYIAYNVRWETYTEMSNYDVFEGQTAREYSKSRYMEYIKVDTYATDEWPGKLRHFEICCEWEIIDIVTIDYPKVYLIKAND